MHRVAVFVLKVGAQELEAELQRWVELHDQRFNAVMIPSMHIFDVVTIYRTLESRNYLVLVAMKRHLTSKTALIK